VEAASGGTTRTRSSGLQAPAAGKGEAPKLAFHHEDGNVHGKDPALYQHWLDKADEGNA
jgi:hypothetical protein